MVKSILDIQFKKKFSKIKDKESKQKIKKQIAKIISNPEIGKPLKHQRKGTREAYASPFRISYTYSETENKIYFLDLYHKDQQ